MPKSRNYLNSLPNVEKIKALAREILDSELKLDKALSDRDKNKKEISSLKKDLKSFYKSENSERIDEVRERIEEVSKDVVEKDNEIGNLENNIYHLQSVVEDEIREGLSQLFHQAKSSLDKAQKGIIMHQTLVDEAQKKLTTVSRAESQKIRDEWIRNVEKLMKDEEKVEKWEKQLEAIKRVYKLEFG